MLVSDCMQHGVVGCGVADSLQDAARSMREHHCGFLAVVNADGVAVGALTDRDICMAASVQDKPLAALVVSAAMSSTLLSVRENDAISHAFDVMAQHHVHRLSVVGPMGHPLGVLTLSDLARAAARGWTVDAAAVTPYTVIQLLAEVDRERL